MKIFKSIVWIICLLLIIALIAFVSWGYYKKCNYGSKKSNCNNGS